MQRRGHNPGFDLVSVELLTYNFAEFSFSFLRGARLNKSVCALQQYAVYIVYFVFEIEKF